MNDAHPQPDEIPTLSLVLGFGPIVPIGVAGLTCWILTGPYLGLVLSLTVLWSAAILLFLAGVRRGLSFRTPGGPRTAQILTMMWLFLLGFCSLLMPRADWSIGLLVVGYASVLLLDPIAAGRDEVPGFFRRLRPPQMLIAVLGLVSLLARTMT